MKQDKFVNMLVESTRRGVIEWKNVQHTTRTIYSVDIGTYHVELLDGRVLSVHEGSKYVAEYHLEDSTLSGVVSEQVRNNRQDYKTQMESKIAKELGYDKHGIGLYSKQFRQDLYAE